MRPLLARKSFYPPLLSLMILFLGGAWIWLSRMPEASNSGGLPASPARGFPAPDFTLSDQNGNNVTLSTLKGQPVLLNFWASWCPPCRAEMPAMQKVYEHYRSTGFVILAVNSTIQDDPDEANVLLDELGISFQVLWDQDGLVTTAYKVKSLPTSFFISPDGIIQEVVIGGPMAEALLISRVEQLLVMKTP